ncbi:UNVERIFIED_CONTAM: hypothetical protein FKN15_057987 [Acipenser sinensis]
MFSDHTCMTLVIKCVSISVPTAVQSLTDDLLKYYQQVALQDLQTNSKIAALLPYFVHVVSGVKSVSHDLEQLSRLLHMVKSLVQNPFLYLGSYIKSLVSSVMYCILEPLAASINPLNDHWTLRDYAALLLSHIFWAHGDLVGGLYHQILLSLQKVLSDPVRPLCSHYGAVVGLHALGWKRWVWKLAKHPGHNGSRRCMQMYFVFRVQASSWHQLALASDSPLPQLLQHHHHYPHLFHCCYVGSLLPLSACLTAIHQHRCHCPVIVMESPLLPCSEMMSV